MRNYYTIIGRHTIYTQVEFNRIYDRLMRFANAKARRFFKDTIEGEDQAAEAVCKVVDKWWCDSPSTPLDEEHARQVIHNSLKYASRKQPQPFRVEEDGFHGRYV